MMEPETSNFFGNELDKAKLEIVSYWKDKYEKTRKALEISVDTLKYANKCIKGGCVNWETEIDKALAKITALEQKDVK